MLGVFQALWSNVIVQEQWPGKIFFKDRYNMAMIIAIGVMLVGQWIFILWQVGPTEDFIPLHYNIYFGIDYLGRWYEAYFLPLLSFLITSVNLIVALLFYKRDKHLTYLVMGATVFLQTVLSVAVMNLIFLIS